MYDTLIAEPNSMPTLHQCWHCDITRTLRKTHDVLQEDRHTDSGNQRDQTVAAAQRAISNTFNTPAVTAGDQNRDDKGGPHQQE